MNKLVIDTNKKKTKINKNIYGHFSEHLGRCIYEGLYVGETSPIPNVKGMRSDVVAALRHIQIPVLRWPGGCFADEYHWKDGIGPKENRKRMINTHWGGVVEDNSFGTHEFMELCSQLGCEPYINGNLGSGTVQEMSEWVEYLTFNGVSPMATKRQENGQELAWKVKYFGIGNENWGCGGCMRPEYYADEYRRYQTYVRNYGMNKIFKIACGPNADNYKWTRVLMEQARQFMDALTLHYYTVPGEWTDKGSATEFDETIYYKTIKKTLYMEELLKKHIHIMDEYDPQKKVSLIVDEWGTWYDVEIGTNPGFLYQQNTIRDAMVAGINLNLFNKNADRICMANIAQTVNVLQAVILTDGASMVLTPTYHVFDLYKVHHNATLLESYLQTGLAGSETCQVSDLHESASIDDDGCIHVTICNVDLNNEKVIEGQLLGFECHEVEGRILTGEMNAHNDFNNPNNVKIEDFHGVELKKDGFVATIPACSVVRLSFK